MCALDSSLNELVRERTKKHEGNENPQFNELFDFTSVLEKLSFVEIVVIEKHLLAKSHILGTIILDFSDQKAKVNGFLSTITATTTTQEQQHNHNHEGHKHKHSHNHNEPIISMPSTTTTTSSSTDSTPGTPKSTDSTSMDQMLLNRPRRSSTVGSSSPYLRNPSKVDMIHVWADGLCQVDKPNSTISFDNYFDLSECAFDRKTTGKIRLRFQMKFEQPRSLLTFSETPEKNGDTVPFSHPQSSSSNELHANLSPSMRQLMRFMPFVEDRSSAFKQLPRSTFLIIFSYLSAKELAISSAVSSKWRSIILSEAHDTVLWKPFAIFDSEAFSNAASRRGSRAGEKPPQPLKIPSDVSHMSEIQKEQRKHIKEHQASDKEKERQQSEWMKWCRTWRETVVEDFYHPLAAVRIQINMSFTAVKDSKRNFVWTQKDLHGLPKSAMTKDDLNEFVASHCPGITMIPNEIGMLKNLQQLSLSFNNITELPTAIGDLVHLRLLKLTSNKLTTLPSSLRQLTKLRSLMVDKNDITSLPDDFFKIQNFGGLTIGLVSLATANFEHNKLKQMPPGLAHCENLVRLNLRCNFLKKFDSRDLPITLSDLTLAENPLEDAIDLSPFDLLFSVSLSFKIGKNSSFLYHFVAFTDYLPKLANQFQNFTPLDNFQTKIK